ncbi:MAG: hypothetical protein NT159_02170 [Proteobacteria bacterium]|nr:hypothetical protein [Pseudomonadota bacterium]
MFLADLHHHHGTPPPWLRKALAKGQEREFDCDEAEVGVQRG